MVANTDRIAKAEIRKLYRRLKRIAPYLKEELGREPTPKDIALILDAPLEAVCAVFEMQEDEVVRKLRAEDFDDGLAEDPNRRFRVAREHLPDYLAQTPEEVAMRDPSIGAQDKLVKSEAELNRIFQEYAIRERIRQIEAKALRKLRHAARSGQPRSFCE
jgi:RNA polymerase primary sigma factor